VAQTAEVVPPAGRDDGQTLGQGDANGNFETEWLVFCDELREINRPARHLQTPKFVVYLHFALPDDHLIDARDYDPSTGVFSLRE
jgi:hypothetical protein